MRRWPRWDSGAPWCGRRSFAVTCVLLRVGTKKPNVVIENDPTTKGDTHLTADIANKHGNRISLRTPESTVVRRPTTRRAFGNRVDEPALFQQDFDRTIKEGLKVNIEVDAGADKMRPIGKASEVGGGKFWEKTRLQPLNPHYDVKAYQATKKVVRRMRDGTTLFTSRDRLNHSHKLTDDQVDKFADNFAVTQWYGFVWKSLRRVDLRKLKRYEKGAQFAIAICLVIMLFIMYYCYYKEVNTFLQLEKREQDDLRKMLQGIRISDLKVVGDEVFEQHDPLAVMSDKDRMTLLIEECRKRGLVDKDWELEKRKRGSLIAEPDLLHIFYWSCMYVGSIMGGGGLGFWQGLDM